MSKTPNFDSRLDEILKNATAGPRTCALTKEEWELSQDEIDWCKRLRVPPSKLTPNTRWKWMAYYDVGYQFWWNKHFDTGEPVLSFHHPASGVRVLPDTEWHSRDFSDITLDHDPEKPFFDQLFELRGMVPQPATFNHKEPENSIALFSFGDRDSYFTFACRSARSYYLIGAFDVEDCSSIFLSSESTRSHAITHSHRIYNSRYIRESFDCMNSAFLFDCRNCENCFGATNKRNKKYLWFNEQLTQSEWEKRRAEVDLGKRSVVEEQMQKFEKMLIEETIWPENFNSGSEDTTGDYLRDCTRCYYCFDSEKGPVDNFWCGWMYGAPTDNAFCWGTISSSECYLSVSSPDSNKVKMCYRSSRCENSEYLIGCMDCRNCFGCVGLRKKEYCIFNKQYTEEEYWKRVDQIKTELLESGEYGEYFPTKFSSAYVPESGAPLYAGASPEDLKALGGNEFDPNSEEATRSEGVDFSAAKQAKDIPDSIDDLTDEWIGVPIYDPDAGRTFSILKPEAEYYRKERIAPPNDHFILRLKKLSEAGQKAQLKRRDCSVCEKKMVISVNKRYPERKIYCKSCYLKYLEQHG